MSDEIKLLKDKRLVFLLRLDIIGFSAIVSAIILYDFLLPYGTHLEVILTAFSVGVIISTAIQITLHKLITRKKRNHDRRLVDDTSRRIPDRY